VKNNNLGINFNGDFYASRNIEIDISGGITFGNNVMISDNVTIHTHKHEYNGISLAKAVTTQSSLRIEDEAWICNNVIISSSVNRIGKGAIIAAGSTLTKDVEDFEIYGGVPARFIKKRKKFEF